ncbi:hypothetical protein KSP40_PGU002933 [Platanthera guangdongensis]|uniref:Sema domain-containing protein n=1 Tax=Platanthera guangdongensis TaxID=2320717 RepID=A0ABR2MIG4_9ASPA
MRFATLIAGDSSLNLAFYSNAFTYFELYFFFFTFYRCRLCSLSYHVFSHLNSVCKVDMFGPASLYIASFWICF